MRQNTGHCQNAAQPSNLHLHNADARWHGYIDSWFTPEAAAVTMSRAWYLACVAVVSWRRNTGDGDARKVDKIPPGCALFQLPRT